MALFSRKKKEAKLGARTLEFDKDNLDKQLYDLASKMYDMRKSQSQTSLIQFIQGIRNRLLLDMASGVDSKEYAYKKGMFDSITYVLEARQYYIDKIKFDEEAKDKSKKTVTSQKSYFTKKNNSSAGLSI